MRNFLMALGAGTALISTMALAQGVPVLSGGVGSVDRAQIEAQQNNYALKLVYSGQGGAFLAGVQVTLTDSAGAPVLATVTDGPILLASPPAGVYTLTSSVNGIEKSQKVTVGKELRTYNIVLPVKDDDDLTAPDGSYLPRAAVPHSHAPADGATQYYAPAVKPVGQP